ncbi:MAG: Smr/MutS family protein, partial [Spirochaetota bacterium]
AGTAVRIAGSGKEGVIYRRGKGSTWVVQVGPVRLPVEEHELTPLAGTGGRENAPSVSYSRGSARPSFELDVRGYRLEDALDEVERQIDQALVSGMDEFGIIHGMGEGILQKGIRDLLRSHPSVAGFEFARPEEGGFGKTQVRLG